MRVVARCLLASTLGGGCGPPPGSELVLPLDTSRSTHEDTGAGVADLLVYGHAETAGQTWLQGELGLVFARPGRLPEVAAVCTVVGAAYEVGGMVPPCEGCTWAFGLGVERSTTTGAHCDDLGVGEGALDGYASGWGFAESWAMEEGAYPHTMRDVVLYYFADEGAWAPLVYTYEDEARGGTTRGDATQLTWYAVTDQEVAYGP